MCIGDDVDSIVQVEQKRYAVREMSAILAHEIYLDNTVCYIIIGIIDLNLICLL